MAKTKIVEAIEPVNQSVVSREDFNKFVEVGRVLAQAIDDNRGTYWNKISVDSDGSVRIFDEESEQLDINWGYENVIGVVNAFELVDDDDDDDDDDDEYQDEEGDPPSNEYHEATKLAVGVEVRAKNDILSSDVGGSYRFGGRDGVLVPRYTKGVVTHMVGAKPRISWDTFNLSALEGTVIRRENNLVYDVSLVNPTNCDCDYCTKVNLKDVVDYPHYKPY